MRQNKPFLSYAAFVSVVCHNHEIRNQIPWQVRLGLDLTMGSRGLKKGQAHRHGQKSQARAGNVYSDGVAPTTQQARISAYLLCTTQATSLRL